MKLWISTLICVVIAVSFVVALAVTRVDSLIYHPSSERVAPNYPGVEAVGILTEDHERLVAWYLPPEPHRPIFLFFDGNGGRPQIWGGRWRRIQEGGAGFLAVYYRGYSGSTGAPSEQGLHLDAHAGYDWLRRHGYQPRDIVIHGFSLGSGVAVRLASEVEARALILEAPFTGVDDVAAAHFSPLGAYFVHDTFRSRAWIGRVRMPVLIVHGDRDSVVPFPQGERMFALANAPKQFVRMRGSDHATLVRDGLYDHIWPFLAAHPAR